MELTLTEQCCIKFCMQLIAVICLGNYNNLFHKPSYKSCKCIQWLFPLIRQSFLIPNTFNMFKDLKMYYSIHCLYQFIRINRQYQNSDWILQLTTEKDLDSKMSWLRKTKTMDNIKHDNQTKCKRVHQHV